MSSSSFKTKLHCRNNGGHLSCPAMITSSSVECCPSSSALSFSPAHSNHQLSWPTPNTAHGSRRKRKSAQQQPSMPSEPATHFTSPSPALVHSRLTALTLSLTKPFSFSTAAALTALLLLSSACSLCAASPCDAQSWWDPIKDQCITCTVCEGDLIPLRPCQLHRDTICGSIYDLKIDWVVLAKTEPNWKEVSSKSGFLVGEIFI